LAVARIDPRTVFTPDEWSRLTSRKPLARAIAGRPWLGHDRGGDCAGCDLAQPAELADRSQIVGNRQLGLAILMHEAA